MEERGLTLSEEKTKVTRITEGFDFLGQNIRLFKDKLRIRPSKDNISNFLKKVSSVINKNKTSQTWTMIIQLNPIIRGGGANYHQHVASSETLNYADYVIWRKLWSWAVRRHPKKGKRWIFRKYYMSKGMWHGQFYGQDKLGKNYTLYQAYSTKLRFRIKIRSDANIYDPKDEMYYEKRRDYVWKTSNQGQWKIMAIWRRQGSRCPMCKQHITQETGWNIHHIVPKVAGGNDNVSNLVLLHPNCHRKIHSNELVYTLDL